MLWFRIITSHTKVMLRIFITLHFGLCCEYWAFLQGSRKICKLTNNIRQKVMISLFFTHEYYCYEHEYYEYYIHNNFCNAIITHDNITQRLMLWIFISYNLCNATNIEQSCSYSRQINAHTPGRYMQRIYTQKYISFPS